MWGTARGSLTASVTGKFCYIAGHSFGRQSSRSIYPDRPWFEVRKDFPGKYECYAVMVAGEWIKMRIEIHGKKANLFLDDAPQPVLVVTDLTQERGRIALWVGTDTVAHFANLPVTPSN